MQKCWVRSEEQQEECQSGSKLKCNSSRLKISSSWTQWLLWCWWWWPEVEVGMNCQIIFLLFYQLWIWLRQEARFWRIRMFWRTRLISLDNIELLWIDNWMLLHQHTVTHKYTLPKYHILMHMKPKPLTLPAVWIVPIYKIEFTHVYTHRH